MLTELLLATYHGERHILVPLHQRQHSRSGGLDTVESVFFAAIAGGLVGVSGSELIRWILRKAETSGRGILRWLFLQLKRPFIWVAMEIREWRRVSAYRHRRITWDDLPQESKYSVSFHDLSTSAREAIKLTDISQTEKYVLIYGLILPELKGSQINGQLQALDKNGRGTLRRSVQIDIDDDDMFVQIDQTGMTLPVKVVFQNASEEIPCQIGARFYFYSREVTFTCKVAMHNQPYPGTQEVTVWIDHLLFKAVSIFKPSES